MVAEPIGREALVAEVARLLATHRAVTLTGPGGAGKTTVARAVTALEARFGPVTWVDLTGVTTEAGMAARVGATLGTHETADRALDDAIDAALAAGTALLALDNLEDVRDGGPWIAARLDSSSSLRVLGTSRRRLGFAGEIPIPVPGLELPAGPDPEAVARSAAGSLFLDRARAIGSRFRLDQTNAQSLHDLLVRLDGLPLAIELAAGRSRVLSPSQMVDRIGSPAMLANPTVPDDRHRSLATVLDWSLDLLAPGERALLHALSPWIGPFDIDVVEAVSEAKDPLSDLDGLIEAGLVHVVEGSSGLPRFRVLETVRVRSIAEAPPDAMVHLASLLRERIDGWAASVSGTTAAGEAWFGRARSTIDHLVRELAGANGDGVHALAVAAAPYWHIAGALHAPLSLVRRAVEAAEPDTRTRALLALSLLEYAMYAGAAGQASATLALESARAIGSRELEAAALYRLGMSHLQVGESDAARDALGAALRLAHSMGRGRDCVLLRHRMADIDQPASATIGVLAALLVEARAVDDPGVVVSVLNDLAANEAFVGRYEESYAHADEARMICMNAGHVGRAAWVGLIAASAAGHLGRIETARSLLAHSAEASLVGGESFQGFVLSEGVSILLALGLTSIAVRAVGAHDAQYARSRQANSADEEAAWQRDVDAVRRAVDAVLWQVEYTAGYAAPLHAVVGDIVAALRTSPRPVPHRSVVLGLTRREVEILTLVGRGLSDGDIAEQLYISPKTASVHLSNIKAKLDVQTRIEAAIRARELGLVARVN